MIGSVFSGRYELTGAISDGPIFSQFSAKDKLFGREISLRIIKPPFESEQLLKEALQTAIKKTAGVQSQNVEKLIELQDDEGTSFIIGELTRAPSLADRIRKLAPFTSPVAVGAAIGICRGLEAFHKQGLVHGDVSGENVAMLADGETKLQMGAIWEAYSSSPTAGAIVLPAMAPYLAPEVSAGAMPSRRSDIYSVGVLLFELLTGKRPYVAETAIATAMKHSSEETPHVRVLNPSVPVVLDEIVYKAMSKDPQLRYAHANELFVDLRQVQDALRFGRTLAWPLRPQDPVPKPTGSQPAATKIVQDRRPAPEPPRPKARDDRDVPVWMLMAAAVAVTLVLTLLGITVFMNLGRPRLYSVPNLAGLSTEEARSTLERLHLGFRIGQSVPNERFGADHVVSTTPATGTKVKEFSPVTVTISAGSREVDVPDLKGLTPDKAREILATEHLVLDENVEQVSDNTVPSGAICKQTPAARAHVDRNQKVHIAVNGPKPEVATASPAAPVQSYIYTLDVRLTDVTEPVHVRIDVVDLDGTRTFYDQVHNPGDPINTSVKGHGAQATFRIYYDDKMVKEIPVEGASAGQ